MFVDGEFCELLGHRWSKEASKQSDIYNGEHYQESIVERPTKWHLSLIMNTDGVDVFNVPGSGKMWPAYLAINELPPEKRYKNNHNIIIV